MYIKMCLSNVLWYNSQNFKSLFVTILYLNNLFYDFIILYCLLFFKYLEVELKFIS